MKRRIVYDIETTSLKPWNGEIICIGIKDVNKEKTAVIRESSEEATVQKFIDYCQENQVEEVIGYKVDFDDRFVFAKCLEYQIPCSQFFEDAYHVDLMQKLKTPVQMYSSNNPGGLDDWVYYLFDENKSEENGEVPEMYENDEIDRIKKYCRKDVELTYQLWNRINTVLG